MNGTASSGRLGESCKALCQCVIDGRPRFDELVGVSCKVLTGARRGDPWISRGNVRRDRRSNCLRRMTSPRSDLISPPHREECQFNRHGKFLRAGLARNVGGLAGRVKVRSRSLGSIRAQIGQYALLGRKKSRRKGVAWR